MIDADEFLEVLRTNRAMRRLRPDPVPDALLRRVLEAATWAPSGSNRQAYFLIAVRDRATIGRIGEVYHRQWNSPSQGRNRETMDPIVERSATRGAETFGQSPVLVVAGSRAPVTGPGWGASVFPAVENLLLAARVLGLGGYLTTLANNQPEVRAALKLPEDATIGAIVPLGFPAASFGPVRRQPLDEVVMWDEWRDRSG